MKKVIIIGRLPNQVLIGGTYLPVIQSMTNTKTCDIKATVKQINKLAKNGAKLVRLAISNSTDAYAIKEIKTKVKVPLIADIHFDYKLALICIEQGIDKIRINPGNMSKDHLEIIITKANEYQIPIRIGVNSGSLEKELLKKYGGPTVEALYESMVNHIHFFENHHFFNLVLSIKATDIDTTIKVNRLLDANFNYPIHIGLTESGTITSGTIRSSYALGTLISEGIGDTIRVSLTGDPVNELTVAKEILAMFGKYQKPTLICCPTCGRTAYKMEPIVKEIEKYLNTLNAPLKVAIMGCAVNGPGEAKEADIGIAGGEREALLFKKGVAIRKIPQDLIVSELIKEIELIIK